MSKDNDTDFSSLLSRLNALKGSSNPPISPEPGTEQRRALHPSITPRSRDVDIEARFRRLASGGKVPVEGNTGEKSGRESFRGPNGREGGSGDVEIQVSGLKSETVGNEEDEVDLDELLAELDLKEGEGWGDGGDGEEEGVMKLLAEARDVLEKGRVREESEKTEEEKDGKEEKEEDSGGGDGEHEDEEAAEEYIQQVMADLEIRRQQGIPDSEDEEEESQPKPQNHDEENSSESPPKTPARPRTERESTPLSQIPSPPSNAPTPLQPTISSDEKIDPLTARLLALKPPSTLTLPKTPTTKPTLPSLNPKKQKSSPKKATPQYTDQEISTWCTICTSDATIRCLDCDNDIYCQECWDEGHISKGAGLEERGHRAVLFSRDKKGLVGAS
ncbi:hypothetical protein E2P81_ATG09406 [Venturia nashicola]|uniref:Uncharacterized protein n=1 Tax=Venturia nashicola TaxID=86259 RepID=A0A4Z1P701_9PEZI|nr:hypothetical protein E6O75_ATG09614 [Venturia nashicola]TLD25749.1 hypothetical protein E2P81_ATG09406 [Venturia nashicola]